MTSRKKRPRDPIQLGKMIATRGDLKVCALNNANSDKMRTCDHSNLCPADRLQNTCDTR
jgi:hypothetical protein